ncbi:MAG: CHASE3 domain-containing protein [Pyrinomonadaceae bacterium]|nr:CHASE3 domain-containing protein [Pyrinomonadaceae bacterium]
MKRGVGFRLFFGFAAALIFILGNAVISFRAGNTLMENYQSVIKTEENITKVEEVFSIVKDAETGQRGYLLTSREEFLEPYNTALEKVEVHINELSAVALDDAESRQLLEALDRAIDIRMQTLAQSLSIYRQGGVDAISNANTLESGRQQMQEIRRVVDEIRQKQQAELDFRLNEARISSRNSIITFIAANVAVIMLLVLVFYLVRRDIQERERAELALQQAHDELESKVRERTSELTAANTELERSNRELQDFAFVASHDLQEPLRKIQAFGDRLRTVQGPKFDDQGRDYLERMHNAAGRMHVLINDLLEYSRVTTKAQPFAATDLRQVAEEVVGDLEVRVQQTGGSVAIGELPTIDADEVQMRQLFQNLVANALKFHRNGEPPDIRVYAEDLTGNTVAVTVEDNGIGFDEKYLDRIFTPFQRLHGRNEYEGTGIGLAVCRKIVERHGGILTAKSTPGKGSAFTFTLPRKQQEK